MDVSRLKNALESKNPEEDIRDAKIIELAKKVKQLTVVTESQKTKIKNLESDLQNQKLALEKALANNPKIEEAVQKRSSLDVPSLDSPQRDIMKENNQMRIKLSTIEGENRKLKVLLQKEIGKYTK